MPPPLPQRLRSACSGLHTTSKKDQPRHLRPLQVALRPLQAVTRSVLYCFMDFLVIVACSSCIWCVLHTLDIVTFILLSGCVSVRGFLSLCVSFFPCVCLLPLLSLQHTDQLTATHARKHSLLPAADSSGTGFGAAFGAVTPVAALRPCRNEKRGTYHYSCTLRIQAEPADVRATDRKGKGGGGGGEG